MHVCTLQNACAASLHHFPHHYWLFLRIWSQTIWFRLPFWIYSFFYEFYCFPSLSARFLVVSLYKCFNVCFFLLSNCHFLYLYNAFSAFVCSFSICNCRKFYSSKSEIWFSLEKYHFSRKQLPLFKKNKPLTWICSRVDGFWYVRVTLAQTVRCRALQVG